jgi:DNA-binding NarL/FixJ family response regulator
MRPLSNDAFGRVDHIATFCWHPTATSVINHRALRPGGCLSIKVLLADDSDVMRRAIAKLLNEEPSTTLVGEAKGFAETIQLANELRPDVLVMDLHMSDEREYSPESVRFQLSMHSGCIVAISVWNDEQAKVLATRFGARVLLDKVNLYSELIAAIKLNCPPGAVSGI